MPVIKLTQQKFQSIDKTKTGWDNLQLIEEYPVLFNTDKIIKIKENERGGCHISYTGAMIESMYVKENLETIESLINK